MLWRLPSWLLKRLEHFDYWTCWYGTLNTHLLLFCSCPSVTQVFFPAIADQARGVVSHLKLLVRVGVAISDSAKSSRFTQKTNSENRQNRKATESLQGSEKNRSEMDGMSLCSQLFNDVVPQAKLIPTMSAWEAFSWRVLAQCQTCTHTHAVSCCSICFQAVESISSFWKSSLQTKWCSSKLHFLLWHKLEWLLLDWKNLLN